MAPGPGPLTHSGLLQGLWFELRFVRISGRAQPFFCLELKDQQAPDREGHAGHGAKEEDAEESSQGYCFYPKG